MSSISDNTPEKPVFTITVYEVFQFLQRHYFKLILSVTVFAILGILYSYTLPKTYKAQTLVLPEYGMGESSSSAFVKAAMGLTNTDGAEKLVPTLYPQVLQSTPFGMYILEQPISDKNNKNYKTLKAYLESQNKPSALLDIFPTSEKKGTAPQLKNKNILFFSATEQALIKSASNLVKVVIIKTENVISIECEITDPVVAAQLVEIAKNYLINYVEDYRTSKAVQQVEFLTQRVLEAKRKQQSAEYNLQTYRDRNRNSFLNVARIEEQRLQSEFTLAQSIYSDLSLKLEQARIKVKEEKPVFKVLEPVNIPLNKNGPNRKLITILFGFTGGILMFLYLILVKEKFLNRILIT
ncbi:hypothetical protein DYBT9275_03826 [Dyadobacter sp. CECT 9275]|uniref:Polysaccharide chain length determinant N-terminal domain-containing protein n=1 Tax=Dyadobacter helix TaxID=2822344 RepID=A0A916JGY0_9BACT|nr:Wzz/FepE/Etk N-terminal domain-containing protein [Dyadobacter sp. CECT 9275]CAG5006473.1 hypothetical protein DYBT9275_03826 [Dyadobacter sp. CECT 9275]